MKTFKQILAEKTDDIVSGDYVWPKDRKIDPVLKNKWSPADMWLIYDVTDTHAVLSHPRGGKKKKVSKKVFWSKWEKKK